MFILRLLYLINVCLSSILIFKKIVMKKNRNIGIYYSGWIFGTALFTSVMFNLTFIMSDIIADSWHNLKIENIILLILMNILNTFITFIMFIGTKKRIDITHKSLIIHTLFSKKKIMFVDIDTNKSEYIFISGKSNKLFPKKNIFTSGEYLRVVLKCDKEIKINMNPLLYSGNKLLFMSIIVKELKIKRKLF